MPDARTKIQGAAMPVPPEIIPIDKLVNDIEQILDGFRLSSAINILKIVSARLEIRWDENPQSDFDVYKKAQVNIDSCVE